MGNIERLGALERKYLDEVLAGQFRGASIYTLVTRLEKSFARMFGVKHAIAMVNGTVTLHAALEAAGVGLGDEVICAPLTMSSTALAVLHANAIPVFADVDPDTFLVTAETLERKITPRTKAVITVALYGLSPDMDPIMALARKHGLAVIEDDAQCFLGTYKGRTVGGIGDMASFSFQGSKHMTSGEGGMVTTNRDDLALNLRRYSGLGYAGIDNSKGRIARTDIQDPDYSRHVVLGWNYRMSDLCGAVALAQLERLPELVAVRIEAARALNEAVDGCRWLVPQKTPADCVHSYWTYAVNLQHPDVGWRAFRDKFRDLGGDGIYAAWKLSYMEPVFMERRFLGRERLIGLFGDYAYGPGLCPVAEALQPRLLQFKTNYWDSGRLARQAAILGKTLDFFGR